MNRVMCKGFYPPALVPKPMPNRWPQNLDFYYAPATTHILINQLKNSKFQEDDMTAISNAKTRFMPFPRHLHPRKNHTIKF